MQMGGPDLDQIRFTRADRATDHKASPLSCSAICLVIQVNSKPMRTLSKLTCCMSPSMIVWRTWAEVGGEQERGCVRCRFWTRTRECLYRCGHVFLVYSPSTKIPSTGTVRPFSCITGRLGSFVDASVEVAALGTASKSQG